MPLASQSSRRFSPIGHGLPFTGMGGGYTPTKPTPVRQTSVKPRPRPQSNRGRNLMLEDHVGATRRDMRRCARRGGGDSAMPVPPLKSLFFSGSGIADCQ